MTTTTHKRSVHISAPVRTVFDYIKDPRHFFAALFEQQRNSTTITDVTLTPEGVGSTYAWKGRMFVFHIDGVMTREEYIPDERIVDRSSTGPVWTFTVEPDPTGTTLSLAFEPDPTGTTLSLAFEHSTKVPLLDKLVDVVAWNGDRDLDTLLANVKAAIEG